MKARHVFLLTALFGASFHGVALAGSHTTRVADRPAADTLAVFANGVARGDGASGSALAFNESTIMPCTGDRMRTQIGAILVVAACSALSGCNSPTHDEQLNPTLCGQSGEFSNSGCARVLVMLQSPPQVWPKSARTEVRLTPARPNSLPDVFTLGGGPPQPTFASFDFVFTMYIHILPVSVDTVSMWIVGRLRDVPALGGIDTTFAADSVLHILRYSPVGAPRRTDTVWLSLHPN